MNLIFRGTRGSTPLIASSVSGNFRSNHSSCIQLKSASEPLFLDAGSALGLALRESFQYGKKEFSILLTHFHWDHIIGFLSFYELFSQGIKLKIYSPFPEAEQLLSVIYKEAYCPLNEKTIAQSFEYVTVKGEFQIGNFKAEFFEVPHSGRTYAIQVKEKDKTLIYMPDVNLEELHKNPFNEKADLLICDAFHTANDKKSRGSWGHSSAVEAVAFAQKIQAKNLALFHYSPTYRDAELNTLKAEASAASANSGLKLFMSQDEQSLEL